VPHAPLQRQLLPLGRLNAALQRLDAVDLEQQQQQQQGPQQQQQQQQEEGQQQQQQQEEKEGE
jgi:hypothetical protein